MKYQLPTDNLNVGIFNIMFNKQQKIISQENEKKNYK